MKWKMKNVGMILFIFLLLEVMCSEGCWKQEREALSDLNSRFGFPMSWLWEGTDCCQWEGVECNSATGRVAKLNLHSDQWNNVNYSDFTVFKDLKSLNLSFNGIVGCAHNKGLENLEVLHLTSNYLNMNSAADILSCLEGLSSLKSLYLTHNWFNATSLIRVFETLSSKLRNLEVLDISYNPLTNDILPSLGGFTSLKELYLARIELDSDLHIQGLCSSLRNLEVFDLSENNFNHSDISSALSGLSSLKSLNLGYSQLTPRSIFNISKLRSLENLTLAGNNLNESILWSLENDGFTWPTNLQVLGLSSNCFSNKFLSSLSGFRRLKSLDLSGNQLEGSLDISGLSVLTSLEILDLTGNRINNFVAQQGSKRLSKLDFLNLDQNMINGSKLRESLRAFPSISMLSMISNEFIGTIMAGDFRDLSNLEHLVLDCNFNLGNKFLESIGELTSLKVLSLSSCGINGSLPTADWSKLKKLEELDLKL